MNSFCQHKYFIAIPLCWWRMVASCFPLSASWPPQITTWPDTQLRPRVCVQSTGHQVWRPHFLKTKEKKRRLLLFLRHISQRELVCMTWKVLEGERRTFLWRQCSCTNEQYNSIMERVSASRTLAVPSHRGVLVRKSPLRRKKGLFW